MVAQDIVKPNAAGASKRPISALNRLSRVPLHQQIYAILRGKIAGRTWAPGDPFPTEIELMEEYQVSRITIRQVMERLASEGLIYRQQGRGTFVAQATLEQGLTRIISFTEDMRRRGLTPGTKVLAQEVIPAGDDVAAALKIELGAEVAYLKRLRFANGEPVCIEESYLVSSLCPGIFETDFAVRPLRETLAKKYGICIVHALQTIHAAIADAETASLFQVSSPAALLYIERTSFDEWERPVEFLRYSFRGDRYSLYGELRD